MARIIGRIRNRIEPLVSERRRRELAGERTVFDALNAQRRLTSATGGRVLEVGPKHGEDTVLLQTLKPSELVLLELPGKAGVAEWRSELDPGLVRYVEANLLYLTEAERSELGVFQLVWCTGVLYHNIEQIRLLARLFELTAVGGTAVVESATIRTPILRSLPLVQVHWPRRYAGTTTVSHLPSRSVICKWMDMVGFEDVKLADIYSRGLSCHRAVVTARRRREQPPGYYTEHTGYAIGRAT